MAGRQFVVIAQGRRYRLGWTDAYAGIWRRGLRGWHLVARYPLGDEGLRSAQELFASVEPSAVYVNVGSGTPLTGTARSRWTGAACVAAAIAAAALVAALLLRPGPSGSQALDTPTTSTTIVLPPPGGGWVSSTTTEVDYVQWNTAGAALEGNLTRVAITGQPPNQRSTTTSKPLTGSLQGRQVAVSIAGGAVTYGSLSGTGLSIDWPQADGTVVPQVFQPVGAGEYDQSVEELVMEAVGANRGQGAPSCGGCMPVPPAPDGYAQIGLITSPGGSKHAKIRFAGRPLELCFAVSDPSIRRLTFQIGSSWFASPTTMFNSTGGNSVTNGCRSDPGNDSDRETVSIHAAGPGAYTVAIYQALQ
jgi:hypothetical protein